MILKRRVSLNGVQLDSVDDRIIITGVDESAGKDTIKAAATSASYGMRVTQQRRETLDLTVKFAIRARNNGRGMSIRAEVLEKVNAWARSGGTLELNYRPGRRLSVILAQAPGGGDIYSWTNEFSLVFRAYTTPYWESTEQMSAACGGTKDSGNVTAAVEGSAYTRPNITLKNTSGKTINTVTVAAGPRSMSFTDLGLAANESLVIDHSSGIIRIRIQAAGGGYRSAMAKRTPASADDFLIAPGAVKFAYSAQRAAKMTATWRNRFL